MSTNNSNNLKLTGNIISLTSKHPQNQQQQHQQQQQQPNQQKHQQQQQQKPPIKQDGKLNPKLVGQQVQTQPHHPPPQPPGGILKHIPQPVTNGGGPKTTIPTLIYPSELSAPHLNIKYPPEVPKLTSVYLSENFRTSRIVPPRSNLRLSNGLAAQPSPPQQHQQRILSEEEQQHNNRLLQTQQQQQQQQQHQQQQQEMLKFVRKPESDPSSTPNSSASGRITSDQQNRHFQVSVKAHNDLALFISDFGKVGQCIAFGSRRNKQKINQ
jgi:hypothetical protein